MAHECMEIGKALGHPMEILDLGGGFPQGMLPEKFPEILKPTKDQFYKVIAEPGRYFSANSCHLAMRVFGKRMKNGRICYHLNDSLYHSFNIVLMDGVNFDHQDSLYDSYNSFGEKNLDLEKHSCNLFGMTCDGRDIIAQDFKVPEMSIGDWMVFGGMGAYTFGPKSQFNGMEATNKIEQWSG